MRIALPILVLAVIGLHQDNWNWYDRSLVFGFLPVGLAYHAFYSLLAAATVALLVRFAWPHHLEDEENEHFGRRNPGSDETLEAAR